VTRTLEDSIVVDAPPDRVWSWLLDLAGHYNEWHPDHVSAEWSHGEPNEIGSRLTTVEDLAGHREKLVFEVVDLEPPRRMEYRIKGLHSIILPGGSFQIAATQNCGSTFTATIRYRFGRLTSALFRHRMGALQAHMHEEGEGLKRLVELAP
jgi:uncharacterized protein YndB with AHSA1/START domain